MAQRVLLNFDRSVAFGVLYAADFVICCCDNPIDVVSKNILKFMYAVNISNNIFYLLIKRFVQTIVCCRDGIFWVAAATFFSGRWCCVLHIIIISIVGIMFVFIQLNAGRPVATFGLLVAAAATAAAA